MIALIPTLEAYVAAENIASKLISGKIKHCAEMSRNLGASKASKHAGINVTFCGLDFPQKVRQWSRKVAKVMNELGVEVAELHETASLLLCRRRWPVCRGFDFLCRNRNFTSKHSKA
jgi:hypothetical protein